MAGASDSNRTSADDEALTRIRGLDGLNANREVQTKVRSDGLTALVTDATVVVESTFGFDQQPDSYFLIVNTGAENDTLKIDIAGTTFDASAPDVDAPAYSKTFTVLLAEVGDEEAFRDRIIQELNQDSTFRNSCFLKAQRATDRNIVHIYSEKFSASGEAWERPNVNDFQITTTGSCSVVTGYDNMISRSKPVTISRDVDSPHRLGLFGITGSVNVTAKELSDIFFQEASNATYGTNLLQNGSVTPVIFSIDAQTDKELFIESLIFSAQGNGIQYGNFLSKGGNLTNGVLIEIKSDNIVTTFPVIKNTESFKNRFAALSNIASNFVLEQPSGPDEMISILRFENPFILRESGAFSSDDYIRVTIRDDLTSGISRFDFAARGFEKEP